MLYNKDEKHEKFENVEKSNEAQKPAVIYLTKENFILWFMIIPVFLLGLHLGAIITQISLISLNFYFEFPTSVRLTGIVTGLWILLSIYLYAKNYNKIHGVVGRSEQLIEEQSNWLMVNTSIEVEKIIDFKEQFK